MKFAIKMLAAFAGLALVAAILYLAVPGAGPRYKVESNGYFYRVAEKSGLSYVLIPDHSPRVSDRFVNSFLTYEETQELIKWLERDDRDKSWRSVSGPLKKNELNVLVDFDPETAVPIPASKCMATSTKGFVVGKTEFRDIRGERWVYTGANPNDVNDYKNWKPVRD